MEHKTDRNSRKYLWVDHSSDSWKFDDNRAITMTEHLKTDEAQQRWQHKSDQDTRHHKQKEILAMQQKNNEININHIREDTWKSFHQYKSIGAINFSSEGF